MNPCGRGQLVCAFRDCASCPAAHRSWLALAQAYSCRNRPRPTNSVVTWPCVPPAFSSGGRALTLCAVDGDVGADIDHAIGRLRGLFEFQQRFSWSRLSCCRTGNCTSAWGNWFDHGSSGFGSQLRRQPRQKGPEIMRASRVDALLLLSVLARCDRPCRHCCVDCQIPPQTRFKRCRTEHAAVGASATQAAYCLPRLCRRWRCVLIRRRRPDRTKPFPQAECRPLLPFDSPTSSARAQRAASCATRRVSGFRPQMRGHGRFVESMRNLCGQLAVSSRISKRLLPLAPKRQFEREPAQGHLRVGSALTLMALPSLRSAGVKLRLDRAGTCSLIIAPFRPDEVLWGRCVDLRLRKRGILLRGVDLPAVACGHAGAACVAGCYQRASSPLPGDRATSARRIRPRRRSVWAACALTVVALSA